MTVVVVIPSRGRPERARSAVEAIRQTAALVSTSIVLAIDADDPEWRRYGSIGFPLYGPDVTMVTLQRGETGNLTRATNTISMRIAREDPTCIIGNVGDDQLALTPGWDRLIEDALGTPGIAYGDDGFQREKLPCGGMFMSAEITLALGYYALPDCQHLFIDNAWRDIGVGAGRYTYIPEIVFEHVHPFAGKAAWDDGYERANNPQAIEHDRRAYESWRENAMATDIGRVRAALAAAA